MLHMSLRAGPGQPVFVIDFRHGEVVLRHRYHMRQSLLWDSDVVVFPPALDDLTYQPQVNIEEDTDSDEDALLVRTLRVAEGEDAESVGLEGSTWIKIGSDDPLVFPSHPLSKRMIQRVTVPFDELQRVSFGRALQTVGDGTTAPAYYRPFLATDEFTTLRNEARARLEGKEPAQYTETDFLDAAYAGNRYLIRLASDPATPPELLDLLVQTGWLPVLRRIARNPQTSLETLKWVGGNGLFSACVARNPALELHLLEEPSLAQHVEASLAFALISNEDDDRNFDEEEGEE